MSVCTHYNFARINAIVCSWQRENQARIPQNKPLGIGFDSGALLRNNNFIN